MKVLGSTTSYPRLTKWHVRQSLKWIAPANMDGLAAVELMDEAPDDPKALKTPAYLRGFLYNGRYFKENPQKPAHVVLYIRDLYVGIPGVLKVTPMATLRIAFTLSHEIGHHIIATRGYLFNRTEKYKPWQPGCFDPYEEEMADAYASEVIQKMCQSWYYRFGRFLTRVVGKTLFRAGIQQYWEGNHHKAASCTFQAYMVDPTNLEAGKAYRTIMEGVKSLRA